MVGVMVCVCLPEVYKNSWIETNIFEKIFKSNSVMRTVDFDIVRFLVRGAWPVYSHPLLKRPRYRGNWILFHFHTTIWKQKNPN